MDNEKVFQAVEKEGEVRKNGEQSERVPSITPEQIAEQNKETNPAKKDNE